MPGELRFSAADVQRHAQSTDAVADAVEQARSAVDEITMDSPAYGQLCQFLPGLLNPIFALAAGTLAETSEALRESAHHLRTAAAEITGTDDAAADHLRHAARPGSQPL
ncbi:type VII secretion target [Actinoplanes sp. NPDC020271]|uniref:type VII secretion target n=1 Tax=Actinoplanes sp. NPDC020271 TaxID=3363896 RepID=UPI00379A4538